MTTANLSMAPFLQISDDNGVPYPGAKVYTYVAGSDTPKSTFTDMSSGIPESNPIVADSGGRVTIWLNVDGLYKLVIKDADDNLLRTIDNVGTGGGVGKTSILINTVVGATDSLVSLSAHASDSVTALGYSEIDDGAGGTFYWNSNATGDDGGYVVDGTVSYGVTGRWLRVVDGDINPKYYGAVDTGLTDNKAIFDKAITFASAENKSLLITEGTYLLSSEVDFSGVPVRFDVDGVLKWDTFSPDMTVIIATGDISKHFDVGVALDMIPNFPAGTIASPRWFGAVCDGAALDNIPISQAIASVSTYGGTVQMDGTSLVNDAIIPASNVTVVGPATITVQAGISAQFVIGSDAGFAHNFHLKNITILGTVTESNGGIALIGDNCSIEDCTVQDCGFNGIQVGSTSTVNTCTNATIRNNKVINCGFTDDAHILIIQGTWVVVDGNKVASGSYTNRNGIKVITNTGAINHISITNNDLNLVSIIVTSPADDLTGDVVIKDNKIYSDDTAILVTSNTNDVVDSYRIDDNNISGSSNSIWLNDVVNPLIVTNNKIIGGTADSTGIIESNVTGDTSYANNVFQSVADWYDVSQPRFETLGTSLRTRIDGDTTVDNNLLVSGNTNLSGNLTITGNVYNATLNNAVGARIAGFDMTNADVVSDSLVINPGFCNSFTNYPITSNSVMVKSMNSVWEEGYGKGGMPYDAYGDGTQAYWYKSWYVFALTDSNDLSKVDAGFDDNTSANNLMPVVASEGYDTYRRIGAVYRSNDTVKIAPFRQKGNVFRYLKYEDNFVPSNSTLHLPADPIPGVFKPTVIKRRIRGAPMGISVPGKFAVNVSTGTQTTVYFVSGDIYDPNPPANNYPSDYEYHSIVLGYGGKASYINLNTDTTGQIGFAQDTLSTGFNAMMIEYTDDRDQDRYIQA